MSSMLTIPFAIVVATATPKMKGPTKFATADKVTAWRGLRTRVPITTWGLPILRVPSNSRQLFGNLHRQHEPEILRSRTRKLGRPGVFVLPALSGRLRMPTRTSRSPKLRNGRRQSVQHLAVELYDPRKEATPTRQVLVRKITQHRSRTLQRNAPSSITKIGLVFKMKSSSRGLKPSFTKMESCRGCMTFFCAINLKIRPPDKVDCENCYWYHSCKGFDCR